MALPLIVAGKLTYEGIALIAIGVAGIYYQRRSAIAAEKQNEPVTEKQRADFEVIRSSLSDAVNTNGWNCIYNDIFNSFDLFKVGLDNFLDKSLEKKYKSEDLILVRIFPDRANALFMCCVCQFLKLPSAEYLAHFKKNGYNGKTKLEQRKNVLRFLTVNNVWNFNGFKTPIKPETWSTEVSAKINR